MYDQGPLNDLTGLVCQVRAVARRNLPILDEHNLVRPVGNETKQETGKIDGWDGGREGHNDEDH